MIGETISHYKILERLGGGGMGVVYKAQDLKLKRTVALKFLPPELTLDPEAKERFIHEAQAASALDHPNICNIHDIAETEDGQLFIVMACYEGETLKSRIAKGQLRIEEATDLAIQIAQGLSEAHQHGIVHRDVKPANILVTKGNVVKIVDFGLAKLSGATKLTKTGSTLGTIAYMSPEQLRGGEPDARVDIFSLGVLLYEMLTGHLPFRGDHEAALMYSITNEAPVPLQSYLPDVSSELTHIINRALEKEPGDRYQTMNDLLIDLRRIRRDTSKVFEPIPFLKRSRLSRKPPFVAALAGLMLVIIAVGAYVLFFKPSPALVANRLAVAVFENNTKDPSLDELGMQITASISQGMGSIGTVAAVPSDVAIQSWQIVKTQSQRVETADLLRAFAERTGAETIVSGAYYKQGDSIQIHAWVTDAESGRLLRIVGPISSSLANRAAAIEQVRQRLLGAVATLFDRWLLWYKDIPNYAMTYDAYREFRVAFELFLRRRYDDAMPHFHQAFKHDSSSFIPLLYQAVGLHNAGRPAQADSIARMLEKRRQSLLKPDMLWLDFVQNRLRGDNVALLKVTRQMAATWPEGPLHYNQGWAALTTNYFREAVSAISKDDPYDSTYWARSSWYHHWDLLTQAHHFLGEHDQELTAAHKGALQYPDLLVTSYFEMRALAALGRAQEIWKKYDEACTLPSEPDFTQGSLIVACAQELRWHGFLDASRQAVEKGITWYTSRPDSEQQQRANQFWLACAYYVGERWAQAKGIFRTLLAKSPSSVTYASYLGGIAARTGDSTEARRISGVLKNVNRPYMYGEHTYRRARIASLLGEKDNAVMLLRDALGQGLSFTRLHADIDLELLRDYPPFQELVKPKE